MKTLTVGNAQLFLVVHNIENDIDYGIRLEVSNPIVDMVCADGINQDLEMTGTVVRREIVDLDNMPSRLKGAC